MNFFCVKWLAFAILLLLAWQNVHAIKSDHTHHHNMTLDSSGMVMNANTSKLPRDCPQISHEHHITVYAGVEYAIDFPGSIYGLSEHEHQVEPCSRITVTFINKDEVRHQWMVHGLPKYLYPAGMFHLEAAGGHQQTGTFIVPSEHKTYLVHCDIAQHMEKGMKAQLKVGKGDGDLWSVPSVSNNFFSDIYLPENTTWFFVFSIIAGLLITLLLLKFKY